MWVLVAVDNPDDNHHLLVGREYAVGRKDCDILVLNDQSISRKHCVLNVTHPDVSLPHPHKPPTLTGKDLSKLGTAVGDTRHKSSSFDVKSGDILLFGTLGTSKFRAIYEPFVTTTSCLDAAAKRAVKQLVINLGGHVVSEWRKDCHVLVMNSLSVTVKVICAMVSQRPIVTPQYLKDLVKATEERTKPPDPDDYIPMLAESQLNPDEVSFTKNENRKTLFSGTIFIFLQPKQFKKLSMAIELAGGTPMLMEEGTDDNEDDILLSPTSCIMHCDVTDIAPSMSQNAHEWLAHVDKLLKKNKRRFINDSEIGYAVLYCCTDNYCNPAKPLGTGGTAPISQTLSQRMGNDTVNMSMSAAVNSPARSESLRKKLPAVESTVSSAAQVKQEPLSMLSVSEQEVPPTHATRGRKPGNTSNIANFFNRSNKPPTHNDDTEASIDEPRVKHEVITPVKPSSPQQPRRSNRGHVSPATSPHRVTRSSRSPSPRPNVNKRLPSPRRGRAARSSRSPSPKPNIKKQSPSPVTRKSNIPTDPKNTDKKKKHNSPFVLSDDEMDQGETDQFDEMNMVRPSRGQVKRRISESDEDEDPFTELEKRKPRKSRKEEVEPVVSSHVVPETMYTKSEVVSEDEREADPFDCKGRASSRKKRNAPSDAVELAVASTSSNIKKEKVDDSEVNGNLRNTDTGEGNSSVSARGTKKPKRERRNSTESDLFPIEKVDLSGMDSMGSEQGYLTTTKPLENQGALRSDYQVDDNLPVKVVVTELADLIARKPQRQRPRQNADGTCMWKGKRVKNFKKFQKNLVDEDHLPLIIGGTDLVAYDNSGNKQLEDMFKDALEAETQQTERDKQHTDLFNWQPANKKRGRH